MQSYYFFLKRAMSNCLTETILYITANCFKNQSYIYCGPLITNVWMATQFQAIKVKMTEKFRIHRNVFLIVGYDSITEQTHVHVVVPGFDSCGGHYRFGNRCVCLLYSSPVHYSKYEKYVLYKMRSQTRKYHTTTEHKGGQTKYFDYLQPTWLFT